MADEVTDDVEEPKKSKTMLIVIIAVVVNLAIVAVVVVLFMGKSDAPAQGGAPAAPAVPVHDPSKGPGPLVDMTGFVANIQSDEGMRYLKTGFVVELVDESVVEAFNKSEKIIRNEVLMYLSSLTVEDASTVKQKRSIQLKLKKLINKRIGSNLVVGVFFTEFVTQ